MNLFVFELGKETPDRAKNVFKYNEIKRFAC